MKETTPSRRQIMLGAAATVAAAALPAAMSEKSWTGVVAYANKPNAIQAVARRLTVQDLSYLLIRDGEIRLRTAGKTSTLKLENLQKA